MRFARSPNPVTAANRPRRDDLGTGTSVLALVLVGHLIARRALVVAGAGGLSLGASPVLDQPGAAGSRSPLDHRIAGQPASRRPARSAQLASGLPGRLAGRRGRGALVFPITFAGIWIVPLGVALAMLTFLIPCGLRATPRPTGAIAVVAA